MSLLRTNKKLSKFEIEKIHEFQELKSVSIEGSEIQPPSQLIISDLT